MADIPPWLEVMRAITGLTEYEDGSNPKIEGMAKYIGRKFPAQASYAAGYTDDSIAWCGVAVDFCLAASTATGISGPFGPTDTDRWMWAQSFANDPNFTHLPYPIPGAIVVMTRSGGGHVTLYEESDNGMLRCRGGNQSNQVNVSSYDPGTVIAYVWPKIFPVPPQPEVPVEDRPMLERGDKGPDVVDLQTMIPNFTGEVDGDFGPTTEENVIRYQGTRGLEVDGIVGPATWQALYDEAPPLPPPPGALTAQQQEDIIEIARESDISSYDWEDQGEAPIGWTQGMALAFAQSYKRLLANHPAVIEMSKARTESDKDVFNEYSKEFKTLGMSNEKPGVDALRHLYALMLGHGMRESSGEHCCGRDQSASNFDSDTCEAGAFQTSYNAAGASNPDFDNLMDEYIAGQTAGYLAAFSEDVSCSSSDWESYGSGRGKDFQDLCKNQPAFSAESAALTLRNLCNHYGPIIRHEAELRADANEMFQAVQDYMDDTPPEPGPEPGQARVDITAVEPVTVAIQGDVYVTVNGEPYDEVARAAGPPKVKGKSKRRRK